MLLVQEGTGFPPDDRRVHDRPHRMRGVLVVETHQLIISARVDSTRALRIAADLAEASPGQAFVLTKGKGGLPVQLEATSEMSGSSAFLTLLANPQGVV